MRGSHPQDGELVSPIHEVTPGKIAIGDQSMRGSHPQDGELNPVPRAANLGLITALTLPFCSRSCRH
jgi:hypothetical protein